MPASFLIFEVDLGNQLGSMRIRLLCTLGTVSLLLFAASAHAERRNDSTERTNAASRHPRDRGRRTRRCVSKPVSLLALHGSRREERRFSLTRCGGRPLTEAIDALSLLARPHAVNLPERAYSSARAHDGKTRRRRTESRDFVAVGIRRLHAGLVSRLQRVAAHWPGRTIEIISGYRPSARQSSRHRHARALDFRVRGVGREALRDFLRTFDATGVGYYPNSVFVHMDVREDRGYWVDESGPGETPRYVRWSPDRDMEHAKARIFRSTDAALRQLEETAVPASD